MKCFYNAPKFIFCDNSTLTTRHFTTKRFKVRQRPDFAMPHTPPVVGQVSYDGSEERGSFISRVVVLAPAQPALLNDFFGNSVAINNAYGKCDERVPLINIRL